MNSNNFLKNTDLTQTPINEGYKYETHSEFMKKLKPTTFSPLCIFCSSSKTISLMDDGSLKLCLTCKKNFKANIVFK
jgi:hypothetical protein